MTFTGQDLVVWPEDTLLPDAQLGPERLGGKAYALGELSRRELPVPEWCLLLPEAFDRSLAPSQREALGGASAEEIRDLLAELMPSAEVRAALQAAARRLCPVGGRLAVRSSARGEDGADRSFAGQLESYLGVAPEQLCARVVDVWRSGFSSRLLAYRAEVGAPGPPPAPAVLIQRMVSPEAAGVAFSADPVSGRRELSVVSSVWGLGESLVSGEVDADTWKVDAEGEIQEAHTGHKHLARRLVEGEVRVEALEEEIANQASLRAEDVRRVVDLARRAEATFGLPQDTEWALEGGELFLLQSRPITTLKGTEGPGQRVLWDCSNIAENYSGVTTPLTFSFARHVYSVVYREFCLLMGAPEDVVADLAPHLESMIGLVQGRMYYNLLNWYRFLSVLPGFKANREFLEHLLGVEALPADLLPEVEDAELQERALDAVHFATSSAKTILNFATLDQQIETFRSVLGVHIGSEAPDLSSYDLQALRSYYRSLERPLTELCGVPALNDHSVMVSVGALRKLLIEWIDDAGASLEGALLSSGEETISGRLARRLREVAALARTREDVVEALTAAPLDVIEAELAAWPALSDLVSRYLHDFGDRFMGELKLESPSLREDPLPLLRAIGNCAKGITADASLTPPETARQEEAEARVAAALEGHPVRSRVFHWVLEVARERLAWRELLRYDRARIFARVRQIMFEFGARLVEASALKQRQDVLYLQVKELLDYVDGCAVSADLEAIVEIRRAEFQRYREAPPPPTRFESVGPVYLADLGTGAYEAPEGESLRGLGCSQGVVRGRVRVVRDPSQADVRPGEIVVAEHTDPGWVLVFPIAAGLLVERGNLLSHAAILARELGLPTVVCLPGLTRWLADGDLVELDGEKGSVVKLESADAADERSDA
jgi:rifampicin phosphotransferase